MKTRGIEIEGTPNPNAIRVVVNAGAGGEIAGVAARSYRSRPSEGEMAGDALARELFAIEGVVGVYVAEGGAWFSVNKEAGASWDVIKRKIRGIENVGELARMRAGSEGEG